MVRLEATSCNQIVKRYLFQFHDGAIRSQTGRKTVLVCTSFNSTMVRLEVGLPPILLFWPLFQFHDGAIRRAARIVGISTVTIVSIPRWCD